MGKEEDALRGQIADGESLVADAVSAWSQWLRGRRSLAELAALIKDHRLDAILTTKELRQGAMILADSINDVYGIAGEEVAKQISSMLDAELAFDLTNGRAAAVMADNSLRLVRELADEQRDTIRAALRTSIEQGMNPNEAARWVRGSIGLTEYQQGIVANYRQALVDGSAAALDYELRDRRSDAAVRRGDLSDKQIDSMVARYQDRFVDYRARVIARTESLRAVHQGTADMWKQATISGDVDADSVTRTWRTAHDGRVRSSHRAMDRQERGLGEAFETGDGVQLQYPGDPDAPPSESVQCRCVVVTRIRRGGS